MSRSRLLAAVALVSISACGTSPAVRYYTLSEPSAAALDKTTTTIVTLGPFDLPEYLQRPNILVRDADQRIAYAEYDRWAEVPQEALVAWLARDVDQQLAAASVVTYPSAFMGKAQYRVRGAVAQWDVNSTGTAVLVVQWDCTAADGTPLLALRTSRYTAQAQRPNNYADIVRALNQTLAEFSGHIARDLAAALPAERPGP